MEPKDKLCLWCKHMKTEAGFAYSEQTWNSGSVDCSKGHWDYKVHTDNPLDDPELLYPKFVIAQTCSDFELRDEIKKYANPNFR